MTKRKTGTGIVRFETEARGKPRRNTELVNPLQREEGKCIVVNSIMQA